MGGMGSPTRGPLCPHGAAGHRHQGGTTTWPPCCRWPHQAHRPPSRPPPPHPVLAQDRPSASDTRPGRWRWHQGGTPTGHQERASQHRPPPQPRTPARPHPAHPVLVTGWPGVVRQQHQCQTAGFGRYTRTDCSKPTTPSGPGQPGTGAVNRTGFSTPPAYYSAAFGHRHEPAQRENNGGRGAERTWKQRYRPPPQAGFCHVQDSDCMSGAAHAE